jgi:hypothetical protein
MREWIYVTDEFNQYRYVLGTKGNNPLITFGINPSTAAPNALDPTVKNTEKLAAYNKFDSWIMLNIYPQRSTDPNGMDVTFKQEEHQKNLDHIEMIFKHHQGSDIVAAWGNLITKRLYLISCLKDIYHLSQKYNMSWKCININKTGHPKHPLYTSIPKVVLKSYPIEKQYHL